MIEIIAVIFSLLSVYFTIKNKIVAWPLGIIGIISYGLYFYNINVMGNMYLQFLFLLQSFYGWYSWKKIDKKITNLDKGENITYAIYTGFAFYIIYLTLHIAQSNFTFFDSITTALSITAMMLMAKHKIQSWYYWIVVDVFYIIFFVYMQSYLSSLTYLAFLILAIIGLKQWNIKIKEL